MPGSPNVRYELIDRIGGGAHGEVWRARTAGGEVVAVKLLGGPGVTKEAQLRFFREQALRFEHPNLVGPLGVTEIDGSFGLVMELVDGCNLDALAAANGGSLPDPLLVSIARDVLAGLGELHEHHVIHRDVTPANVLVSNAADGGVTARLGDFGSALDLDGPRLTSVPGVVGTRGYAAPELFEGGEADAASDLWSLGATLAHLRAEPPRDHDPQLDVLISALAATDPDQRPRSAADAAALLGPSARPDVSGLVVPGLPPVPRRAAGRRRAPAVLGAAAALIAGVVVTAVVLATRSGNDGGSAGGAAPPTTPPAAFQTAVAGTDGSGFDSSVGVDARGRPIVAHTDLQAGNLLITACEDRECQDAVTEVADGQPRTGYYPSLRLTRSGLPVVAYQDSANGRLVVRRCTDRGCTSSEVSEVPLPGGLADAIRQRFTEIRPKPLDRNVSLLPRLELDSDTPVVTFDDVTTDQVWLARCSDPRCSEPWTIVPVGPGAGNSLALSPEGRPIVAGTGRAGMLSFGPVWMVECADPSCGTSSRVQFGPNGSTASIAADDKGYTVVAVSYVTPAESDGIVVVGCTWGCAAPATNRYGKGSDPDGNPSVVRRDGRPVIAYRAKNAPAPGLQFVDCADAACVATDRVVGINEEVPEAARAPEGGHDVSITLDPDGRAVASSSLLPSDPALRARLLVSGDA